jgi:hypothetical protein
MDSKSIVSNLMKEKEEVLAKISKIEVDSEGLDHVQNVEKVNQFESEKARLIAEKNQLKGKISGINAKLNEISVTVGKMSNKGREKILAAIKDQRWFFFKNKPHVVFDKITGYLWPNLDYFKYRPDKDSSYTVSACRTMVTTLEINGYKNWIIPFNNDVMDMIDDKSFPFISSGRLIKSYSSIYINRNDNFAMWLDGDYPKLNTSNSSAFVPCNKELVSEDYRINIDEENKIYSETERLQFTLNVFIDNQMIPIFSNSEVTELYQEIYIEKPVLIKRMNEIQAHLEDLQEDILLSSSFDYRVMLDYFDLNKINGSILTYYQSIQLWIDDLLNKIDYFEKGKGEVIADFNVIGLSLAKQYEHHHLLTEEEIKLFEKRRIFFKKNFELGMNEIKNSLLLIKQQAEEYEDRIESVYSLRELAEIEGEKRPSFQLVAEHTSNLIKKGLVKIEFFEQNKDFASEAVKLEAKWLDDYEVFISKLKDDFRAGCEDDSIDESTWLEWFENWRKTRFIIEGHLLPFFQAGLKRKVNADIITGLLGILQAYKESVDQFYLEERKDIHQKFAFQAGGDLQEKFEVESELYKLTAQLQKEIQDLIFGLDRTEEKLLVLKLTDQLMNIQIDEILDFIKDRDLSVISMHVLTEFSSLKQKNFDQYLGDIKAYTEEGTRREKEYNALVFKMRKELMKQGQKVGV